ncbi:hypothetical protein G5I_06103 [Acromyrmex echinatior]|uniref:Uncharacterized protein n=1 Tax=Acromyrmex echinatior TaxID=103372 RepID=F4WK60_ACREC|nr:hypothetical protein G5I_06103 [Acromyrmex echinatior]
MKKKTKAALKRKVGARIETQFDPRYEAPAEVGSPRAHLTYNNVESIKEYKCTDIVSLQMKAWSYSVKNESIVYLVYPSVWVSSFLCSRRVRTQHHSPSSYLASRKAKVGTRATEWIDTDSPYPRYLRVAESTLGDAAFFSPARRFRDEREDRKKKAGVRSLRSLYETSNERVPKGRSLSSEKRELSVKCPCFPVFDLIIDSNILNEKDEKQEEEKGAGEQEKKFAANGVSLMNAFFVSGKQRGPGPILPGSCAVR